METEEQILQAMQKVHEEHHMSVVLVMKYGAGVGGAGVGVGTGFIIKSTEKCALVITNYHVIEQGKMIRIRLSGSSVELIAQVQHFDEEADLAILRVNMPAKYPELVFREKSKDVRVGELVFLAAYYNPDMLGGVRLDSDVHHGRICGPLYTFSNPDLTDVVHSCRSKGGCSGGPLIYDSKVIGVHFQTRTQIEYARSSETVNTTLKKWLYLEDEEVRTIEEMIGLLQI